MAESFLLLSRAERSEALGVVATASGRPAHLLEKDVWVVWALQALFSSPVGESIVFKGGTSLSKAYGVIQRFSEDLDLTYDVRKIIPDLAKGDIPLPANNAQAKKWRDELEPKLDTWVKETILPILEAHLKKTGGEAKFIVEGSKIVVDYDRATEENQYMPPRVTLEFGARSTGEPCEVRPVVCHAAENLDLIFPTASPRAMLPVRTFWEKATAVHAFCLGEPRGDRISRHWYDLVRLDEAGYADDAFANRALAIVVHGVQQLSAEAARAAISGLTDQERASLAQSNIAANVNFYPMIASDRLTITSTATDPSTSNFSVTLNYDASNMVVFNLPSIVPSPPQVIIRSASIQRGGY